MATLSQDLKKMAAANPQAMLHVVITASKTEAQLKNAGVEGSLEPIPGLDGIFKGTFTGQQLLSLESCNDIDTVEPDGEAVALNG